MYKSDQKQLKFENFYLPFGGKLRSDNRWVKLAKLIPWADFEELYANSLAGTGMGAPAKSVRVALGALIIKERLGTSDEETVEQIRENPYLQAFLGFHEFRDQVPFDPSLFVYFRKRFSLDQLGQINGEIVAAEQAARPVDETDSAADDDSD